MQVAMSRRRIAVVSPFIDKRHGTERRVAECISRLAEEYEFHVYSNRVEDVNLDQITWHRVPALPGPHLFAYVWWFVANHLWRWRDRRFGGLVPDLVYSPGVNCLDADVLTVHVVFTQFRRAMHDELSLRNHPLGAWPRLIHRRLYYRLIAALERRIYPSPLSLIGAVSHRVARELHECFARENNVRVLYQGIDHEVFHPRVRWSRRPELRRRWNLSEDDFVLLLIGNGWKNKGLPCVLASLARLPDLPVKLLVVGKDDRRPYLSFLRHNGLAGRVLFLEPSADVAQFYSAADVYVGPSLYDSFAQPPLEAMACGLPVITSGENGGSEIIANGIDGFVLRSAEDDEELANLIRALHADPEMRCRIAASAAEKAMQFTWQRNARQMSELFADACPAK
jgi:UDP-glucose:(heptosyl)LPS alpha-1,3-glucosyltransferase